MCARITSTGAVLRAADSECIQWVTREPTGADALANGMPGTATLMPNRSYSPPEGGLPHLPAAYTILAAQQHQPQGGNGGAVSPCAAM